MEGFREVGDSGRERAHRETLRLGAHGPIETQGSVL